MPVDNEIYFKVAADLSDLKPQFQDLSKFWDKHNADVAKGEKAYRDYANSTEKAYQKVNQKIKENIGQVANEGKALQQLEKYFKSISEQTDKAFDTKDIKKFNQVLSQVSGNFDFNLSLEDLDDLRDKLNNTKDDLEATNVVLDFFEDKLNSSNLGGEKFKELATNVSDTKKQLQEAQEQLNLVNSAVSDYEKRPVSQKSAGTFVDLRTAQEDAKAKVQELTIALTEQEKAIQKEANTSTTLTSQLRKVKDELIKLELEGGRGSERWVELSKAAKKYETAVTDVNQEIKRTSSNTAGLDQLIGAATGLVGVFSAAQGAQALFGDESKDLGKALVKLTGAIALLNGLQSIQSELAKKDALATRALTFVKTQYAVATDASAAATIRLGAALKLLGIGLIIGGIAALVVYWKDIAKFVGITSEKTERLNEINKSAASSAGDEIGRLKALQLQLVDTNTPLDRQKEIKEELLKQYPGYLKVLGDEKASAEDIEKAFNNLNKALLINAKLKAAQELISTEYKKVLEGERKAAEGEISLLEKARNFLAHPFNRFEFIAANVKESQENLEEIKGDFSEFEKFIQGIMESLNTELSGLGGDPNKDGDKNKDLENYRKQYENFLSIMEKLINRRKELETSSIENNRDREKAILTDQFEAEKLKYQKEINALEISQERKLELTKEFNRLYNEESGIAYADFKKGIADIDAKFDKEFISSRLKTLAAINAVYLTSTELERIAIKDKYEVLRQDILEQMKQTKSAIGRQLLTNDLIAVNIAEAKETKDFDFSKDEEKLDRQREIAKSTLEILKANNSDLVNLEKLHNLELLMIDQTFYNSKLDLIKQSFEDIKKQGLFTSLVDNLQKSKFIEEMEAVKQKLIDAFGEKTAAEIIKTVEALQKIKENVEEAENSIKKEDSFGDKINKWTSSLESFSDKLTEVLLDKFPNLLEESGITAKEFSDSLTLALSTVFDSIQTIFAAEVQGHKDKLDSLQNTIDGVENELDRERELYEQGFANNFEARNRDLQNLKDQKRQEEEELKKAQKRKAALAKAEFLLDTVSQLGNLITASTNIFKWASAIPFIGIPLAIGLIGTMFGAFAIAKTKALQVVGDAPTYRTGLKKGRLSLDGPPHEQGGFGLYNSKSGERVAEFEGGEDVLVFNKQQKRNYTHILDAMIADANGKLDFETSIRNHYNFPSPASIR